MENHDILRIKKYHNVYEFNLYQNSTIPLFGETELTDIQSEAVNLLCAKLGGIKCAPVSEIAGLGKLLIPELIYENLGKRQNPLIIFSNEIIIPWELIQPPPDHYCLSLTRFVCRGMVQGQDSSNIFHSDGKQEWLIIINETNQDSGLPRRTGSLELHIITGKRIKNKTIEKALAQHPVGIYCLDGNMADSKFWGDSKSYYADILNGLSQNNLPDFLFLNSAGIGSKEVYRWVDLFIKKGIRHIAAPAWQVQYDPASNFGLVFLEQLTHTGDISSALQQAKMEYRNRHPIDPIWAAYRSFVQISQ